MLDGSFQIAIAPVSEPPPRPLWSVMIPSYNCAGYLRKSLASVLAQDPGREMMQIEVVDDFSTHDNPEAVVKEVGRGRVGFYRQPHNVGHVANFNTCLQRSRGKLVHILHCDDYVLPGFYRKMQQPFETEPEIGGAFCRHTLNYDDWSYTSKLERPTSGVLQGWLKRIASKQRIQASAMVVRRDVYESLGGFDRRITCCGEDWEMWVRLAARYPVWFEVEPLAVYRGHQASLTGRTRRTGKHIRDTRLAIEIFQSYLPNAQASTWTDQARESVALWALKDARKMIERGDLSAALVQVREAISCNFSPQVRREIAALCRWTVARWIRRQA